MKLLKIGRDASCDIILHSDKVSTLHAEITLMNSGDIMLEDKGSRNGTFIMNQQIKPGKAVSVRRGDAIRFADVELQWSQVPMPEDNSKFKAVYGIGSHFNNDIQISGGTVSRYHATIKVGRDNKVYIIDHSKNGTTVDGKKILSNDLIPIKKSSAVVCGGVPVDLKNTPIKWPNEAWKAILGVVAGLLVLFCIGYGAYKIIPGIGSHEWTQKEINARYNSSTMLLVGMYHFEVECGDLPPEILNAIGIPTKFYYTIGENGKAQLEPFAHGVSSSSVKNAQSDQASGFFISKAGKILTNLHVAKPWLFDKMLETVETYCRNKLASYTEIKTGTALLTRQISGLSGYISQLKVKGVSDGILLIPQGSYYSVENAILCHIVSAGDNPDVDVALIQCDKQELPNSRCTYVNVTDSMDVSEEALQVGEQIFTIGFPHGMDLQDKDAQRGLQAFCHGGHITMVNSIYNFNFDATSYHGASGSPIFNDRGFLIGILNSGVEKEDFNRGIKAKYIKELLESPNIQ